MAPREFRQHRYVRPAGATELIIVRHGESQPAVRGQDFPTVQGHADPALAPDGRRQAEQVGQRLAVEQIDAIYVTSLRRTVQTAAPLAARLGLEPNVEADLREVFLGEWEGGVLRQKAAAKDPLFAEMARTQRWEAIPGAEPQAEFIARIQAGLGRIAIAHPNQRVAVFTHGGVIGQIMALALRAPVAMRMSGADNGSISHVVANGADLFMRRFNDTSHLDSGFDRPSFVTGFEVTGDLVDPDRPG